MASCSIRNKDLFNLLIAAVEDNIISAYILPESHAFLINNTKQIIECEKDRQMTIDNFFRLFKRRWLSHYRKRERFIIACKDWLNEIIYEPPLPPQEVAPITPSASVGRPSINFLASSERSKRRKSAELVENTKTSNELLIAAAASLRKEGRHSDAKDILKIAESEDDASLKNQMKSHSSDKALAIILDCGLSKSDYQNLRNEALAIGSNIYPTYNDVRNSKAACMPPFETITISDFGASINLQALMDHTAQRLFLLQKEVISSLPFKRLTLRHKIGFDGSTGQSIYNKSSSIPESRNLDSENSIFMTCTVPLELAGFNAARKHVLWKNPTPSSTLYCRPVRFRFIKETAEISQAEEEYINNCNIQPTVIDGIVVNHITELTMVDGKVATALSDLTNSSQCCSVCGASPKEMNNIELLTTKPISANNLKYGLSTLHAWMRCMECLLHVAYKANIKKWQARTADEKESVKERKREIQTRLRDEIGLIVDLPQSGGAGTSNTGNTGRRFFQNAAAISQITGIDESLISNIHIVLSTLSSGLPVDITKLRAFSIQVAKQFVSLYSWYYMPQSLHRILMHSHEVVERMVLPIGCLSEEAQESRNKDFKKYREQFTRKMSRMKTNEDLVRRLLCSSDPIISQLRRRVSNKRLELPSGAKQLLICRDPYSVSF